MKKIPLTVYEFAGDLRVMAHFLLRIEELSRFIPVKAIVDTGSPVTLIGPLDTARIRISSLQLKRLIGKNKPVNIGGGKIMTKMIEKAKLSFSEGFECEMPVDFPIQYSENPNQPSLLGVDFLIKTKAKLIFNPSKKEAYLEIEE